MEGYLSTQEQTDVKLRHNGDVCQPCNFEGKHQEAHKYCCDCEELLCSSCVAVHGKLKATRHHRIVDKNDRAASNVDPGDFNMVSGLCSDHPTEPIKYECVSHESFICGHCAVREHRACNVNILSEAAKEFVEGPELKQLHQTLSSLSLECDQSKYQSEENVKLLESSCDKACHEIDEFFEKVSAYFIEKRDQLKLHVAQLKERIQNDLINSECDCNTIQKTVETLKQKCAIDKDGSIQLFIEARQAKPKLVKLKERITAAKNQNRIDEILFKKDPSTETILESSNGLGRVCYKSGTEIALLILPVTVIGRLTDHWLIVVYTGMP